MPDKQLQLDWTRGRQLAALRNARLNGVKVEEGKTQHAVSGVLLKAVLKAIDDHGRECWASQATLAVECGCRNQRQVKRAIKALQAMSLITCERKRSVIGRSCNHYRVVWSELELLCQQVDGTRSVPTTVREERPSSNPVATAARAVASGSMPRCLEGLRFDDGDAREDGRVDGLACRPSHPTTGDQSAPTGDQSAPTGDQSAPTGVPKCPTGHLKRKDQEAPHKNRRPLTPTKSTGGEAGQLGPDWRAAAEALRDRLGVRYVTDAIAAAKQRELTPAEVIDAVETAAVNAALWDRSAAGACVSWIRSGVWPAEGVADPRVIRDAEARREAERAARNREAERDAANRSDWEVESRALEAAYGAELNGLDAAELQDLARIVFRTEFHLERFRRNPADRWVRYQLLVAVHANRAGGDHEHSRQT